MENLSFHQTDLFKKSFNQFKQSTLCSRLIEKFRLKPYYERNAKLFKTVRASSFILNCISILTASGAIAGMLASVIPAPIAIIIAVVVLGVLEAIKRQTMPATFQSYYQFKTVAFLPMLAILFLFSLSAVLSFVGAKTTVQMLMPLPELVNQSEVQQPYKTRIAELEAKQANIHKTMNWRGKLTRKGAEAHTTVQKQIAAIENQMLVATDQARTMNAKRTTQFESHRETAAFTFAGIALVMDVCLFLAFWFMEYYDFRSFAEMAEPSEPEQDHQQHSNDQSKTVVATNEAADQDQQPGAIPEDVLKLAISRINANISAYRRKLEKGIGDKNKVSEGLERWETKLGELQMMQGN